jgi:hypothetical protein
MAEESQTSGTGRAQPPGGTPGIGPAPAPPGGPLRSGRADGHGGEVEGDLLAERRARRAGEPHDSTLARRAEAAEATVRTLESHVAALQERLGEAEEHASQLSELLEAERAGRANGPERPPPGPTDTLDGRVRRAEQDARSLAGQLRSVERELTEAERIAAGERAMGRRAERELRARVCTLEEQADEIRAGLAAERGGRETSEHQLESLRRGHRRLERLLGELRRVQRSDGGRGRRRGDPSGSFEPQPSEPPLRARRIAAGESEAERGPRPSPTHELPARELRPDQPAGSDASRDDRGGELADALAAAVERLQARAGAGDRRPQQRALPARDPTPAVVAMSPSQEPLRSQREISRWAAWLARRLERRRR